MQHRTITPFLNITQDPEYGSQQVQHADVFIPSSLSCKKATNLVAVSGACLVV